VQRYVEKYEVGVKLPPLIVQKDTYVLIAGYHRYEALKRLGRDEVEVEIVDIPDSELIYEAYRSNDPHGLPVSKLKRNLLIWRAYNVDGKNQEQIAETFQLSQSRVNQILKEMEYATMSQGEFFNYINTNKIKVVPKNKAKKRKQIIELIKEGKLSNIEIAKQTDSSEGYVSQIKQELEKWNQQAVVLFKIQKVDLLKLLKSALVNGLLKSCVLTFTSDKLIIKNISETVGVVAEFTQEYFLDYEDSDLLIGA